MSFDEFKGWLRGYLENDGGVDSDRILEELEKVDEVEAAPVGILPTPFWPVYRTSGERLTVPVAPGDGFVWNDETVAQFNEYKVN